METLFLAAAIFGGTVIVAQFFLGLGGQHGDHGDMSDDGGGDSSSHHDGSGDDSGGDNTTGDSTSGNHAGGDGDMPPGAHDGHTGSAAQHTHNDANAQHARGQERHGSTWVFGVLSFRTVMIGLTFFGLTGKASLASGFQQPLPLLVALGCGLGSMYGVYFLMRGLYRLTADGTERIGRCVGQEAMVYLTIPGGNAGPGKIHVTLQNRLVEFEAMTAGEKLPTGTRVIVVGVLNSDRVAVEAVTQAVSKSHV